MLVQSTRWSCVIHNCGVCCKPQVRCMMGGAVWAVKSRRVALRTEPVGGCRFGYLNGVCLTTLFCPQVERLHWHCSLTASLCSPH